MFYTCAAHSTSCVLSVSLPTPVRSARDARLTLACFGLLAAAGLVVGWDKGQLPKRDGVAQCPSEANCATPQSRQPAPDLALYAAVISDVRAGRGYYDAAHERIPEFGFPISSPLNWRLPTYAWLLSLLPGKCWIQGVLLILGIGGLGMTFLAERAASSIGHAAVTTFLMFGVFRWVLDGDAYLAQEVWAGVLMMISVAAMKLGQSSLRLRVLAAAAGIAALMFRELALPFCVAATALTFWQRRYLDAAVWTSGLVAFGALLAWHICQVRSELAEDGPAAASAGLAQWIRFGGLDFVLLTLRMNSLLFHLPGVLLWLFLLSALLGLASRPDSTSRFCCCAALLYIVAFAVVGRSENFYWGLMVAPLLPWGMCHAPRAISELWLVASGEPNCSAVQSAA